MIKHFEISIKDWDVNKDLFRKMLFSLLIELKAIYKFSELRQ